MDDHSLTLVVAVGSGTCDFFEGIEATETATEVRIVAVVSEKDTGSGLFRTGCTDDLGTETVEVVLQRPLGNRTLTGCAPGDAGLKDYFGQITDGRTTGGCAEIITW